MWGERFLAAWIIAILICGTVSFHTQAPLVSLHCPPQENAQQHQATPENCAAFDVLFVRSISDLWGATGGWVHEKREDIAALATVAIAGFTIVLAIATVRLWRVSERSLTDLERAFVFIDGFNVELTTLPDVRGVDELSDLPEIRRPELHVTRFAAQPRWKNGGNTPTRNMTIEVDWRGPGLPLAHDFNYTSRWPRERFFLGPQAIEISNAIEMPGANALINDGHGPIDPWFEPMMFIWGRADYEDIFGHHHFTQWCYRLRFEAHDRRRLRAQFIQWGEYNRTDETSV
jgi:hypothetical protein